MYVIGAAVGFTVAMLGQPIVNILRRRRRLRVGEGVSEDAEELQQGPSPAPSPFQRDLAEGTWIKKSRGKQSKPSQQSADDWGRRGFLSGAVFTAVLGVIVVMVFNSGSLPGFGAGSRSKQLQQLIPTALQGHQQAWREIADIAWMVAPSTPLQSSPKWTDSRQLLKNRHDTVVSLLDEALRDEKLPAPKSPFESYLNKDDAAQLYIDGMLVDEVILNARLIQQWQRWALQQSAFDSGDQQELLRSWQGCANLLQLAASRLPSVDRALSTRFPAANVDYQVLKLGAFLTMRTFGKRLPFLQLVDSQDINFPNGDNVEWTVKVGDDLLSGRKVLYVTFGATRDAAQWLTENANLAFDTEPTRWGPVQAHKGIWTAIKGESQRLGAALKRGLAMPGPEKTIIVFCGFSKGGAEAVGAAARLLAPGLALGNLTEVPQGCSVAVMTAGAPRIFNKDCEAFSRLRTAFMKCLFAEAYVDPSDPIPDALGPACKEAISYLKATAAGIWNVGLPRVDDPRFDELTKLAATYGQCLPEKTGLAPGKSSSKEYDNKRHDLDKYAERLLFEDKLAKD